MQSTAKDLRIYSKKHSFILDPAQLAAELGLRGADSTYVAVAARLDIPLSTLDADQKQRASKQVNVLEI